MALDKVEKALVEQRLATKETNETATSPLCLADNTVKLFEA